MMKKKETYPLLLAFMIIALLAFGKASIAETNTPKEETQVIKNISPQEAHVLIEKNKKNPDFVILDVRTPEEFSEGHIENAVNLDFYSDNFKEDLEKLDKNKTYITHCRSGSRSAKTLNLMKELGFKEAYNITGGIVQWENEGLPTTK
ncbi:MAG TPA: rhodanese-like domain-containing protein [Thermodesulfobacteriota bacterium]|nr:rhodanese-like domain-containing protein [Thermodesulfobacteriota bacterium]